MIVKVPHSHLTSLNRKEEQLMFRGFLSFRKQVSLPGFLVKESRLFWNIFFFFCLLLMFLDCQIFQHSIQKRSKRKPWELTAGLFLRSKVPSWPAFFSLPFSVSLCLFSLYIILYIIPMVFKLYLTQSRDFHLF